MHALDGVALAIDDLDLIGAQDALGLDEVAGDLMHLEHEQANGSAAIGQFRLGEVQRAAWQADDQTTIAAGDRQRCGPGRNGSADRRSDGGAWPHRWLMQNKGGVQRVDLILHRGWFSAW